MWMPWAFWALHRAFETRRLKFGLLTGFFLSLQMLSSIYYGVFLIVVIGVVTLLLLLPLPLKEHGSDRRRAGAGGGRCRGALRRLRDSVSRDEEGSRRARRAGDHALQRAAVELPRRDAGERRLWRRCSSAAAGRSGGCFRGSSSPCWRSSACSCARAPASRSSSPTCSRWCCRSRCRCGLSGYSYRFLFDYVPVFRRLPRRRAARHLRRVLPVSPRRVRLCRARRGHAAVVQARSSSPSASPCSCSSTASGGSTWSRI